MCSFIGAVVVCFCGLMIVFKVEATWDPRITCQYLEDKGVLQMRIAPPQPGADSYDICVERLGMSGCRNHPDHANVVEKSREAVVYDVRGLEVDQYYVLVQPVGEVDGPIVSSDPCNVTSIAEHTTSKPTVAPSSPVTAVPRDAENILLFIVISLSVVFLVIIAVLIVLFCRDSVRRKGRNKRRSQSQTSQASAEEEPLTEVPVPQTALQNSTPPSQLHNGEGCLNVNEHQHANS